MRDVANIMSLFVKSAMFVPEGYEPLNDNSTDEQIDRYMERVGYSISHAGGTAAMSKVVDTKLRVKGVEGLRVVDTSILPRPMSGHAYALAFVIALKAADLIFYG